MPKTVELVDSSGNTHEKEIGLRNKSDLRKIVSDVAGVWAGKGLVGRFSRMAEHQRIDDLLNRIRGADRDKPMSALNGSDAIEQMDSVITAVKNCNSLVEIDLTPSDEEDETRNKRLGALTAFANEQLLIGKEDETPYTAADYLQRWSDALLIAVQHPEEFEGRDKNDFGYTDELLDHVVALHYLLRKSGVDPESFLSRQIQTMSGDTLMLGNYADSTRVALDKFIATEFEKNTTRKQLEIVRHFYRNRVLGFETMGALRGKTLDEVTTYDKNLFDAVTERAEILHLATGEVKRQERSCVLAECIAYVRANLTTKVEFDIAEMRLFFANRFTPKDLADWLEDDEFRRCMSLKDWYPDENILTGAPDETMGPEIRMRGMAAAERAGFDRNTIRDVQSTLQLLEAYNDNGWATDKMVNVLNYYGLTGFLAVGRRIPEQVLLGEKFCQADEFLINRVKHNLQRRAYFVIGLVSLPNQIGMFRGVDTEGKLTMKKPIYMSAEERRTAYCINNRQAPLFAQWTDVLTYSMWEQQKRNVRDPDTSKDPTSELRRLVGRKSKVLLRSISTSLEDDTAVGGVTNKTAMEELLSSKNEGLILHDKGRRVYRAVNKSEIDILRNAGKGGASEEQVSRAWEILEQALVNYDRTESATYHSYDSFVRRSIGGYEGGVAEAKRETLSNYWIGVYFADVLGSRTSMGEEGAEPPVFNPENDNRMDALLNFMMTGRQRQMLIDAGLTKVVDDRDQLRALVKEIYENEEIMARANFERFRFRGSYRPQDLKDRLSLDMSQGENQRLVLELTLRMESFWEVERNWNDPRLQATLRDERVQHYSLMMNLIYKKNYIKMFYNLGLEKAGGWEKKRKEVHEGLKAWKEGLVKKGGIELSAAARLILKKEQRRAIRHGSMKDEAYKRAAADLVVNHVPVNGALTLGDLEDGLAFTLEKQTSVDAVTVVLRDGLRAADTDHIGEALETRAEQVCIASLRPAENGNSRAVSAIQERTEGRIAWQENLSWYDEVSRLPPPQRTGVYDLTQAEAQWQALSDNDKQARLFLARRAVLFDVLQNRFPLRWEQLPEELRPLVANGALGESVIDIMVPPMEGRQNGWAQFNERLDRALKQVEDWWAEAEKTYLHIPGGHHNQYIPLYAAAIWSMFNDIADQIEHHIDNFDPSINHSTIESFLEKARLYGVAFNPLGGARAMKQPLVYKEMVSEPLGRMRDWLHVKYDMSKYYLLASQKGKDIKLEELYGYVYGEGMFNWVVPMFVGPNAQDRYTEISNSPASLFDMDLYNNPDVIFIGRSHPLFEESQYEFLKPLFKYASKRMAYNIREWSQRKGTPNYDMVKFAVNMGIFYDEIQDIWGLGNLRSPQTEVQGLYNNFLYRVRGHGEDMFTPDEHGRLVWLPEILVRYARLRWGIEDLRNLEQARMEQGESFLPAVASWFNQQLNIRQENFYADLCTGCWGFKITFDPSGRLITDEVPATFAEFFDEVVKPGEGHVWEDWHTVLPAGIPPVSSGGIILAPGDNIETVREGLQQSMDRCPYYSRRFTLDAGIVREHTYFRSTTVEGECDYQRELDEKIEDLGILWYLASGAQIGQTYGVGNRSVVFTERRVELANYRLRDEILGYYAKYVRGIKVKGKFKPISSSNVKTYRADIFKHFNESLRSMEVLQRADGTIAKNEFSSFLRSYLGAVYGLTAPMGDGGTVIEYQARGGHLATLPDYLAVAKAKQEEIQNLGKNVSDAQAERYLRENGMEFLLETWKRDGIGTPRQLLGVWQSRLGELYGTRYIKDIGLWMRAFTDAQMTNIDVLTIELDRQKAMEPLGMTIDDLERFFLQSVAPKGFPLSSELPSEHNSFVKYIREARESILGNPRLRGLTEVNPWMWNRLASTMPPETQSVEAMKYRMTEINIFSPYMWTSWFNKNVVSLIHGRIGFDPMLLLGKLPMLQKAMGGFFEGWKRWVTPPTTAFVGVLTVSVLSARLTGEANTVAQGAQLFEYFAKAFAVNGFDGLRFAAVGGGSTAGALVDAGISFGGAALALLTTIARTYIPAVMVGEADKAVKWLLSAGIVSFLTKSPEPDARETYLGFLDEGVFKHLPIHASRKEDASWLNTLLWKVQSGYRGLFNFPYTHYQNYLEKHKRK